jgi:oligopeptide/dipeptide ABC transporter ATP-binding protein
MKVTQPTPQMATLAISILPKHIWEHIPESKVSSYNPTNTVGTGPYIVTSFVPNQSITLKANPFTGAALRPSSRWCSSHSPTRAPRRSPFRTARSTSPKALQTSYGSRSRGSQASLSSPVNRTTSTSREELGLAAIVVTHDLGLAWNIADRLAVMYLGRIVEMGTPEQVFADPRHPYTRALMSVLPESPLEPIVLSGEAPDPSRIPSDCRFHPRCPALASGASAPPAWTGTAPARRWRSYRPRLQPARTATLEHWSRATSRTRSLAQAHSRTDSGVRRSSPAASV